MSSMTTRELEEIQRQITKAEQEHSRAEGALESMRKSWKAEFGCDTIEEMEAKLAETEAELQELEKKLEDAVEDLRKKLPEDLR